jgi:probable phosphoglycerate mutase
MHHILNPTPFIFLRHGETSWNQLGLAQGRTDVPLSESGKIQAIRAAAVLGTVSINRIVASPLSRALDTATTVANAIGLAVETDDDLQEANFGKEEGLAGLSWYDQWLKGEFVPEDGEPFNDLAARAVRAVNRATSSHGVTLIVGHGAWFRALRYAMGIEPNVRPPNGTPMQCSPPTPAGMRWTVSTMFAGET